MRLQTYILAQPYLKNNSSVKQFLPFSWEIEEVDDSVNFDDCEVFESLISSKNSGNP